MLFCFLMWFRITGFISMACYARMLLVEYRLAPESKFPAQIKDAIVCYPLYLCAVGADCSQQAAYDYLLAKNVPPAKIVFMGDSAGGNLVLCTCLWLQSQGRRLPRGIVLLSPWLDLTYSNPSSTWWANASTDYLPTEKLSMAIAALPGNSLFITYYLCHTV